MVQDGERWSEERPHGFDLLQVPGEEPLPNLLRLTSKKLFIKKDEPFLELLQITGVEKMFSDVIFRMLPYLTPPGTSVSAMDQTIAIWRSFDREVSDINRCSPLQATYLKVLQAKQEIKILIKQNKAAEAKMRMEKDGIYALLNLAQIHLDKCRAKKLNTFPFGQAQSKVNHQDLLSTFAEPKKENEGNDSGTTLDIDDQSFQIWLTSS